MFGASVGKFLGFIVHEKGIEVDPRKVETIKRIKRLECKKDVQSLLGKVNYLRRFISNLVGRVESLLPLFRLKHEKEFTWRRTRRSVYTDQGILDAPTSTEGTGNWESISFICCCTGEGHRRCADPEGWW
jgi:hypothetical protein